MSNQFATNLQVKPYYDHAGITIYHGDCREILPSLSRADLVLTDPPYGIEVDRWMGEDSGNQRGSMLAPKGTYQTTSWDNAPPDPATLALVIAAADKAIVWGGNYFSLPPARCVLVWDKENGTNQFADCELAWTNLDKPVRLKRHLWNGMLRKGKEIRFEHPTQKPVEVISWCITLAGSPSTILDPFMGSGTTLVAAKNLGRRAIGIEIEEKYCALAVKRLAQEVLPGVG